MIVSKVCRNCGGRIDTDDGGAMWYHKATVSAYCDGDDAYDRARYWSELADGVAVPQDAEEA